MGGTPRPGTITWTDLTVENAEQLRDFYESVIGWSPEPVAMGGYSDYAMNDADGDPAAGICHARGGNADLPPQWLVYITVDDLEHSIAACQRLGGSVVAPPRSYAGGRYCVIKDPAGAVCALYQPPDAA
jgi:predicted enzyme related to lactoylglutathione lyase